MRTRREFLLLTAGSFFLADVTSLFGAESRSPWKLGICDWDLRATGRMSSFAAAKELGFAGVQISYQPEGPDSLAVKENRPKFLEAARESGVDIASIAIGMLNGRPLATTPEAVGWLENCLDAMDDLNVDRVLVPFFGKADMNEHKDHQPIVVEKLKHLAPTAVKKKKTLAVESYLSAEDNLKLLDAVASDAVKVYYDVRNSLNKGYDIYREIENLGKRKLISEIHFKEDRCRLGDGEINFPKVCEVLEKVDYNGWVVVENAAPGDWKESQAANARFVKKLFEQIGR